MAKKTKTDAAWCVVISDVDPDDGNVSFDCVHGPYSERDAREAMVRIGGNLARDLVKQHKDDDYLDDADFEYRAGKGEDKDSGYVETVDEGQPYWMLQVQPMKRA